MNKKFIKKLIISTVLVILIGLMVLALLYTIVGNTNGKDKLWIVFIVWGGTLLLSLIALWIYQILRHKNEKK